MKNLFNYATKELSQDAFLRWLFENYDCEDNESLKNASNSILKKLCNITDEEIRKVETYAQWQKIDIFAVVETDRRSIALFIEDKVFSFEHNNQLEKYNGIIEKSYKNRNWKLNSLGCTENDIVKIFYKPSYIFDDERRAVEQAGWKVFGINCILKMFDSLYDTDCTILKQYIEHIREIEKAWKTEEMPSLSKRGLDLIKWQAYFEFQIKPKLNIDKEKYDCKTCVGSYDYTYLYITKKVKDGEKIPYIELRSRDVSDEGFSVTLLCYGVDYNINRERLQKVTERIETAPNKVFLSKNKRSNEPKQLGRTGKTNEDMVSYLKKCIEDYDYIMKEW
ncbi:MAG: PD-(D/E)XK nuclease family protein [Clostridia bacterium]|nr:PD-(D/E)XK nuclease family protein [Clostridia bacterium]